MVNTCFLFFILEKSKEILENIRENNGISCSNLDGHPVIQWRWWYLIFCEVNVQYPEKLHELYNDLLFVLERMKIGNVEKHVGNLSKKRICHVHKNFKTNTIEKKCIESFSSFKKLG